MADPYDPANPSADPLRSSDDNYQNLGGLPYANMDPNAPMDLGGGVPPPPPAQAPPLLQSSDKALESKAPGRSDVMVGDGIQELPDSDPSESKNYRVDKPKVKKLKKKIKRVKIIYWVMTGVWAVFLILFVLIHLNTFGVHVLPFLQKE